MIYDSHQVWSLFYLKDKTEINVLTITAGLLIVKCMYTYCDV